jgi:hypothetical protein
MASEMTNLLRNKSISLKVRGSVYEINVNVVGIGNTDNNWEKLKTH